jgi:hypothetical protein
MFVVEMSREKGEAGYMRELTLRELVPQTTTTNV